MPGTRCLLLLASLLAGCATSAESGAARSGLTVDPAADEEAPASGTVGDVSFFRSGPDPVLGIDAPGVVSSAGRDETTGDLRVADGVAAFGAVAKQRAGIAHYAFGLFDGVDARVEPGRETSIDVNGRASRRQLRIVAPGVRALPDAACSGLRIDASRTVDGVTTTRSFHGVLPPGTSLLLGEYVVPGTPGAVYTTGPIPLSLVFGLVAGSPVTMHLHRIDVTDTETDATRSVHGTYTLDQITSVDGVDTVQRICAAETGTGVDVGPGRYQLVVTPGTAGPNTPPDVSSLSFPLITAGETPTADSPRAS